MDTEWVSTDPDNDQWGRQISHFTFEFREGDKEETINLLDYTEEEIESDINSFGYTLYQSNEGKRNISEQYYERANWIIAECIFEFIGN